MKRFIATYIKPHSTLFDTYLYYFLLALVVVMPLHAFLAVSLGNITGYQAVWQAWKEVGLLLGGFAALGLYVSQPTIRERLAKQPAIWSASAFIVVALTVSLITRYVVFGDFLLGAKTTLAFLVLFVVMQTIEFTTQRWKLLLTSLLAISSAIGIFALAQVYLLPKDFLVQFGYGSDTLLPFHLVDPAVKAIRIIATFSGPNQLGSFMILPLIISFWLVTRKKWLAIIPLALTSFALLNSYSRSSWIGAAIAIFVTLLIRIRGWWKLTLIAVLVAAAIGGVSLNKASADNLSNVRYYVFHGRPLNGKIQGSDQSRIERANFGLQTIQRQPLGYGLGTAGPASKNSVQPLITENTYLQIGIETGVIGLLLFGLTIVLTIVALIKRFAVVDETAPLVAIIIGLSVSNLFLHTWADSATALVLWGLTGYVLTTTPNRKKS